MRGFAGAALATLMLGGCSSSAGLSTEPRTVVVDGVLAGREWTGSQSRLLQGGATLLLRQDAQNLFVGVDLPPGALLYADLYVGEADGTIRNFHTSMRQGERTLSRPARGRDPLFVWEPTSGWEGSTPRFSSAPTTASIRERIAHLEAYEMRIPYALLGPPPWRLRLELRDFEQKSPDAVYPPRSTLDDPSGWMLLGPRSTAPTLPSLRR